ncbi:hypothetical protein KIN20_000757 [Parelaphostrongylus tenuis]|uniref:Uncharacterized protein n=1 Tax=Parelaphostrongylus tenuis TaxID=148309 RepID=A0AAD5MDR8_PARTN|nr:hypothetical protein KIN20_000757 [Parelaphostrongylus tenuis]
MTASVKRKKRQVCPNSEDGGSMRSDALHHSVDLRHRSFSVSSEFLMQKRTGPWFMRPSWKPAGANKRGYEAFNPFLMNLDGVNDYQQF